MRANGSDVALVTATIVDKNGLWCPDADHNLHFSVEGPGQYRGSYNFYVDPSKPATYHAPAIRSYRPKAADEGGSALWISAWQGNCDGQQFGSGVRPRFILYGSCQYPEKIAHPGFVDIGLCFLRAQSAIRYIKSSTSAETVMMLQLRLTPAWNSCSCSDDNSSRESPDADRIHEERHF